MTEKERADFDAVLMLLHAKLHGETVDPTAHAWAIQRLADRADDAANRVRGRLERAAAGNDNHSG